MATSERDEASRKLGEEVRSSAGAGPIYDSLRRQTDINVVAHPPRNISEIVQTDHFEITVLATSNRDFWIPVPRVCAGQRLH